MNCIHLQILFLCLWALVQAEDNDALRECGNLHHLEFRNLPSATAEYSNNNCKLKCSVGNQVLSQDAINEGFACPLEPNGVCRNGQCEVTAHPDNDALRECGNLHHEDFHKGNGTGSIFSPDHCFLKCVLNGQQISSNNINEGYPCQTDAKKICQMGQCVNQQLNPTPTSPLPPNNHSVALVVSGYKLHQVEIVVHSLTFNRTAYYIGMQTLACVEDVPVDGTCHTQAFGRHCESQALNQVTATPHWNQQCYFHGAFNSFDNVILHVRFGSHSEAIGWHVENLNAMFNRHYLAKHFTSIPWSFSTEEELPILNAHDQHHQQIGLLNVSVLYNLELANKPHTPIVHHGF